MSDGPDPGAVIVAIFLILFGVCLALLGGGCTIMLVGSLNDPYMRGGFGLLLLGAALAALAAGIFLVRHGITLLGPRDD